MADGRKNNGGHKTAGRKSKADEQSLVEKLKPFEPQALKTLKKAVLAEEQWAVKLYMEYMFGRPKQTIDSTFKFQEQPLFLDVQKDNSDTKNIE